MTGYTHPVMTITGSGNQGIFIGLPYQRLHARHGDRNHPAVVFSLLAQIHLSARHQRLSSTCGLATKAAPALARRPRLRPRRHPRRNRAPIPRHPRPPESPHLRRRRTRLRRQSPPRLPRRSRPQPGPP